MISAHWATEGSPGPWSIRSINSGGARSGPSARIACLRTCRRLTSSSDGERPSSFQRLDPSSFQELRGENKLAVAYAIPEQSVVTGLKDPTTMIGSDAILTAGNNNHPRSTGCFRP